MRVYRPRRISSCRMGIASTRANKSSADSGFVGRNGRLTVVCTENLNPNVLTMKSAQYGARIYDAGSLNLARDRRIFVQ